MTPAPSAKTAARKKRRDFLDVATRSKIVTPSLAKDATPEAFAVAMVKCQGYAPACSDAGECANDGFCFSRDGTAFKIVHDELSALFVGGGRPVYERAWLRVALDALDHHRMVGSQALDALRLVAINKRVRREYGAAE